MDTSAFASPTYAAFSRLVRVQTALWRAVDMALRDHHYIALADVTALHLVAGTDGARVQDLAATLHITVGGASKVVDRLVAADLVTRAPHPTDRRSSVLTVTPSGYELLNRTSVDVEDVLSDTLGGVLGADGITRLDELLRRVESSIEAHPEETVA
jgi:MarR family multiple antibiotic resistance transcriptional regulator